ncbi:vinculin-like isoform X3 [Tigriopus californicus]|uniref:vinculin-like isoform X3 n=1 Tax=Tigriopus californicus TaxID=6832 RepID=UPI0027DA9422|nr:vinculin-like isoform X3 [Tigriopus californicus]
MEISQSDPLSHEMRGNQTDLDLVDVFGFLIGAVSRLVIIHEEGEAGHEMPDLERPVFAVSKAVTNLVKVGREMSTSTDDLILKQDMPQALNKVDEAARLLVEAAKLSKIDPLSKPARMKLIEGSRWILQGTSNVLLVFDESEVRKIVQDCKKTLDYLSVAEVVENMEDLVQFVRDLSPILSRVTVEVCKRTEDLTHQIHREVLNRCVEQVKTLAPILICSMKIFIQILSQDGKGVEEAAENRNYLCGRMSEELNEIIRVLQLTTYDEDEWDSDNLTVMKKVQNAIESSMQNAHDWLKDPKSLHGGVGEKSVRRILEQALKVAERSLPLDSEHMKKLVGDIQCMTDSLCELRQKGEGTTPQAETLAANIESRLHELVATVQQAINRVEKSGIQQPAPTVSGRLEQARRWLEQPAVNDRGLGQQAIALVVEEGLKIADVLPAGHRDEVGGLCRRIQTDAYSLTMLCQSEQGESPRAVELARSIAGNLNRLKDVIRNALVDRVVNDFLDAGTPLKQFTECVLSPHPAEETRDRIFEDKAIRLTTFSERAIQTAKMVAVGTNSGNKKVAEALLAYAAQVDSLAPQLVNAGRIRMTYPENKAADEHFENLRHQYAEAVHRVRGLCDEATDSLAFIEQSLEAMEDRTAKCEDAVRSGQALKMVENTSALARMTNRVIQVAKQEAENSEDPRYISELHISAEQLQARIAPMVQSAKSLAMHMNDDALINEWRSNNRKLLDSVEGVKSAVAQYPADSLPPPLPPYPKIGDLSLSDTQSKRSATMPVANGSARNHRPSYQRSHGQEDKKVFTDSELSEIFQIDFGEIFGSPDITVPDSNYRGINLPSKNHRGTDSYRRTQKQLESKKASQISSSSTSSSFSYSNAALPPPSQFANGGHKLAKSASSGQIKVPVLPSLSDPVQFGKPPPARPREPQPSHDQIDADALIDELMREAENDPGLRKMSGLDKPKPPAQAPIPDKYAFVARPYRTAQDMIIRDHDSTTNHDPHQFNRISRSSDKHRSSHNHRSATQRDQRISEPSDSWSRSKSADSRPSAPYSGLARKDPKLSNFKRTSSSDNFTEGIMHEVVTDQDNHSVKDLVAMIEKNTTSESVNPYIRKWGCDLISPEPHTKTKTYRRERRQMPDYEAKGMYNWTLDSSYRSGGMNGEHKNAKDWGGSLHESSKHHDKQSLFDNDFRLSAHVADMDDLLGKSGQVNDGYASEGERSVHWPPEDQLSTSDKRSASKKASQHLSASNGHASSQPPPKATSAMDEQIASIQCDFEAELDNMLLDTQKTTPSNYPHHGNGVILKNNLRNDIASRKNQQYQHSHSSSRINKKMNASLQKSSARKTASSNKRDYLSSSHAGMPPLAPVSDEDGSYQALSVVFQDIKKDSGSAPPPRPPPPSSNHGHSFLQDHSGYAETTDDESEDLFLHAPTPSQGPIMMAAHDLHQEVKQWSSKDNDIIAAAKKMALLMAKLSQLVNEDTGSKRDLIACAKATADASEEVTRIAKELAKECTDKRMRTSLLQVCERIPTIATQLKILSTVKATMLGAQGVSRIGTEEDQEATEMLVGNAQNLMQSVKQTVTAAEAASIKIRTDAGIKLRWVRKQPWYQY